MRLLPVALNGETYMVRQHDDGTFEMPPELAALRGGNVALKPGQEMWWLVRKPLQGTVSQNVTEYGTGALNIDACRIGTEPAFVNRPGQKSVSGLLNTTDGVRVTSGGAGRWPANVVFTHSAGCCEIGTHAVRSNSHHPAARGAGGLGTSGHAGQDGLDERRPDTETVAAWDCAPDCPVAELDRQSGVSSGQRRMTRRSPDAQIDRSGYGTFSGQENVEIGYNDAGGASRFFHAFRYQAKAPSSERPRGEDGTAHVTVKPQGLMQFLVRLITPPGGTVLDCFAGSGATAEACIVEGFRCVLIELEQPSAELIRTRLRKDIQPVMFGAAS